MSPLKLVVVKTRRGVVLAALVAAVALPAATYVAGARVSDNCESINRVVDAGSKILDPEVQLGYARTHGLVSRREYGFQLERARRLRPLTQHYLAVWRSGACK
jgi:hypothetical protein